MSKEKKSRNELLRLLKKGKEEWEATFDAVPELILITDSQGRIIRCNRSSIGFLRTSFRDLLHRNIGVVLGDADDFLKNADRVAGADHFRDVMLGDSWFNITRHPLALNKQAKGLIFILHDITRRREAQQRLEEANRELSLLSRSLEQQVEKRTEELARAYRQLEKADKVKSEFVSSAAHELRTPLTPIIGFCEILLRKDAQIKPEQQRYYLELIYEQARNLSRTINELLDIYRLEAGREISMNREPFFLGPIIKDCLALYGAGFDKHTIRTDVPANLPAAYGDKDKIMAVLLNLLNNAVHHSPSGGHILVKVEPRDNELSVMVQDEGPGVAPAEQEKIFERFYRSRVSRETTGSGLGLSICRHIINAHGGRIWVESVPGRGSAFYFTLPCCELKAGKTNGGAKPETEKVPQQR